jgi:hypothetical protein
MTNTNEIGIGYGLFMDRGEELQIGSEMALVKSDVGITNASNAYDAIPIDYLINHWC